MASVSIKPLTGRSGDGLDDSQKGITTGHHGLAHAGIY